MVDSRVNAGHILPNSGLSGGRWYPKATARPLAHNFAVFPAPRPILYLVLHIANGMGSPYDWFNRRGGDVSAHFWVSRAGVVEQYRPLDDVCWSNGPLNKPNLERGFLRLMNDAGTNGNTYGVAIEHEGLAGEALTPVQQAASIVLTRWLAQECRIHLGPDTVLRHSDFDSETRGGCPGFDIKPWYASPIEELFHAIWPETETIAHAAVEIQRLIGAYKQRAGIP